MIFISNPFIKKIYDYENTHHHFPDIGAVIKKSSQSESQAGNIMQKTSLKGKIEICAEEGIVIESYKDSIGVWTIGVGVTAAAGADINPKTYRGKITVRHAVDMMESVLPQYEKIVRDLLDGEDVSQHVFDGLVCAAYNIGPEFAKGKMTRKYIRDGRYRDALIMWKISGGKVSRALLSRRHREADICENGKYHADIIPVYDAQRAGRRPRRIYDISASDLTSMIESPKVILT